MFSYNSIIPNLSLRIFVLKAGTNLIWIIKINSELDDILEKSGGKKKASQNPKFVSKSCQFQRAKSTNRVPFYTFYAFENVFHIIGRQRVCLGMCDFFEDRADTGS